LIPQGGRYTASLRPSAGPGNEGKKDTVLDAESVASAEYTNKAGEFKGGSFNNLNEEEMNALNQMVEVEEHLLEIALNNRGSKKDWAV
jgi:hypothetical protein